MAQADIETEHLDVLLQNTEESLRELEELIKDADDPAVERGLRMRKNEIKKSYKKGREAMEEAKE